MHAREHRERCFLSFCGINVMYHNICEHNLTITSLNGGYFYLYVMIIDMNIVAIYTEINILTHK